MDTDREHGHSLRRVERGVFIAAPRDARKASILELARCLATCSRESGNSGHFGRTRSAARGARRLHPLLSRWWATRRQDGRPSLVAPAALFFVMRLKSVPSASITWIPPLLVPIAIFFPSGDHTGVPGIPIARHRNGPEIGVASRPDGVASFIPQSTRYAIVLPSRVHAGSVPWETRSVRRDAARLKT